MIFKEDLEWLFAPALADQLDERDTRSLKDPAKTAKSKQAAMRPQIGALKRDLGVFQKSAGVPREVEMPTTTAGGSAEATTPNSPT